MKSEQVCGVLVTYRPSHDFAETVRLALGEVSRLVIVVNDPEVRTEQDLTILFGGSSHSAEEFLGDIRIRWILNRENVGLSRAYNQAVEAVSEFGCEFLLFLDQDSRLEPGAVGTLLRWNKDLEGRFRVGALGCVNLEEVPVAFLPKAALQRIRENYVQGQRHRGILFAGPGVKEVFTLGNSGLLTRLARVREVGAFDEHLFLDAIDYDFSFRLLRAGYRNFQVEDARVRHRQGEPYVLHLFGRSIAARTYSSERSYHILRDTLESTHRNLREFPVISLGILLHVLISTAGAVLLLPEKQRRGSAALRALQDFSRRRTV